MDHLFIRNLVINKKNHPPIVNLFSKNQDTLKIESSLALVGQSGSGKSLTLKTILNLLPADLEKDFQYECDFKLNSQNIAFIPQNAFTALSPMTKIKDQFFLEDQTFQIDTVAQALKMVELDEHIMDRFPLQLSGGQLQRIVIAIALSKKPKLLLLDEPTTALDSETKNSIIELLKALQKKLKFLMIFVSHDIESVENICQKIAILENGAIVEYGNTQDILQNPKHPYTLQLINSSFSKREFRR